LKKHYWQLIPAARSVSAWFTAKSVRFFPGVGQLWLFPYRCAAHAIGGLKPENEIPFAQSIETLQKEKGEEFGRGDFTNHFIFF
jgi:hypothetical protein